MHKAPADLPTGRRLREVLRYDPLTGALFWLVSLGSRAVAGQLVEGVTAYGYQCVGLDGRLHQAHRLIWCWMTDEWPSDVIDHIDGDRMNNRWHNLRDTNNQANRENTHKARVDSSTGVQGVSPCRQGANKGYQAKIRSHGRQYYLGVFNTAEEARAIYVAAKLVFHSGWVPPADVSASGALRQELEKLRGDRARRDSASGVRGVRKQGGVYVVRHAKRHVGCFPSLEAAQAAYEVARAASPR